MTPPHTVIDRSVLTAAHNLLGTPPFRAPHAHNGRSIASGISRSCV